MKIKPIKTEADYDATLAEIDRLMGARPGSAEGDKLEILTTLVEAYEARHWPIDPPDPIDAIRFAMENRGLTRADLERCLGSRSRVSEILGRKRRLTTAMAWRLHEAFGIPAENLIRPYALKTANKPGRRKAA